MNDAEKIMGVLTIIAVILVMIILVLILVYLWMKYKKNNKIEGQENTIDNSKTNNKDYNIKSIFNFMEFDKIEDNMIIQKKGKYLMVVECQGINFDLMSEMERTSVEQGFIQFLNTLRSEIQIYIQTRTVNLENSISTYKEKFRQIEDKYTIMNEEYKQMKKSNQYDDEDIKKAYFELVKQRNKYEYAKDVIADTEKNSLNNSVLQKKYYIIIPYYEDEMVTENLSKEEIQNMVFSDLYTKSKSIIRTLTRCGINSKILDSTELIELLYIAYNRDDSDILGARTMIKAGFEDLYTTAPDVFEKKLAMLNKQIEEEGLKVAGDAIEEARSEKEMLLRIREQNKQNLIYDFANDLIDENSIFLGEDVASDAKAKVKMKRKQSKEEGGKDDGKETKTRRKSNS